MNDRLKILYKVLGVILALYLLAEITKLYLGIANFSP